MPAYAEQNQAFLIRAIQCYVHVMKRINPELWKRSYFYTFGRLLSQGVYFVLVKLAKSISSLSTTHQNI